MNYLVFSFVFIFGLLIGSFLNCLIWRLHKEESMWPKLFGGHGEDRSYCPKCGHTIFWYDNIPVFSFLMLLGRCRHCRKKISWQYPIVELAAGILFLISFYLNFKINILDHNFFVVVLRDWFVISTMILIFIYDLKWYLILDTVTLPACAVAFLFNLYLGIDWKNLLISGIIGSSFFLFQFVISNGKWIGGGDIRLGLLMGLMLGWPNIIIAIFLAYIIGSFVGLGLVAFNKKKWGSEVPLGVFLSTATVIVLLWGDKILNWYLNLFI